MIHTVSFALLDSINALLIGVIVAMGVMLPARARYGRTVSLLIIGDWCGVFVACIPTLLLFGVIKQYMEALIASPIFGIVLIATGVLGFILTLKGGDSGPLIARLLGPLRAPSFRTFLTGFVLGVVQSLTSGPFFGGLAYLVTLGFDVWLQALTLMLYASLALSLPTLSAVLVGFVRAYPQSRVGGWFQVAREHKEQASRYAGYFVAIVLVLMGVAHL